MVVATRNPQYQVRALERALQILSVFSLNRPQLSLTEIAAETDLSPATALRLLSTLSQFGYIERSPDTDRFRIGVTMFERGCVYIQTTTIESEARNALEGLARATNQTASLAVLDRTEIVHIAVTQPDRAIRYFAPVGQREAVHCTGLGKVLLAFMDDDKLDQVVSEKGLSRRTENTITDEVEFKLHLERVRDRGFAVDDEESLIGLRCVACPVYDSRGQVVAAVSASGASTEFSPDDVPKIVEQVQIAAKSVSFRLGFSAVEL
jgi:DNA-binding IclR family transcriptional regulator